MMLVGYILRQYRGQLPGNAACFFAQERVGEDGKPIEPPPTDVKRDYFQGSENLMLSQVCVVSETAAVFVKCPPTKLVNGVNIDIW